MPEAPPVFGRSGPAPDAELGRTSLKGGWGQPEHLRCALGPTDPPSGLGRPPMASPRGCGPAGCGVQPRPHVHIRALASEGWAPRDTVERRTLAYQGRERQANSKPGARCRDDGAGLLRARASHHLFSGAPVSYCLNLDRGLTARVGRGSDTVDATGTWLVGAKGEYPFIAPIFSSLRRPTQPPRRRSRILWRAPRRRLGRPMRQACRVRCAVHGLVAPFGDDAASHLRGSRGRGRATPLRHTCWRTPRVSVVASGLPAGHACHKRSASRSAARRPRGVTGGSSDFWAQGRRTAPSGRIVKRPQREIGRCAGRRQRDRSCPCPSLLRGTMSTPSYPWIHPR